MWDVKDECGLESCRVNKSSSRAMRQKCGLVATKSTVALGCVHENIMSRIKEVIILCHSTLVRPYQGPSVQLWAPHFKGRCQQKYIQRKSENSRAGGGVGDWQIPGEICPLPASHYWAHGEEEAVDLFCV